MKAFVKIFGIFLIGVIMSSCEKNSTEQNLMIKIENISNYDYHKVVVSTTSDTRQFGTIPANTESVYRSFESAYRYAYVEAVIQGEKYIIQPIDYVGEQLLEPGRYTYIIDADEDAGQYSRLKLHLKND